MNFKIIFFLTVFLGVEKSNGQTIPPLNCPVMFFSNLTKNMILPFNSSQLIATSSSTCSNTSVIFPDPFDINGMNGYQCFNLTARFDNSFIVVQGCAGARINCSFLLPIFNSSNTLPVNFMCCMGNLCSNMSNQRVQNPSMPPGQNPTTPPGQNPTMPPGQNYSMPPGQNSSMPPGQNPSTLGPIRPKPNVNPFSALDPNAVYLLKSFNASFSNDYILSVAANSSVLMSFFDMLTGIPNFWKKNCPLANAAYAYLENALVLRKDTNSTTLTRLQAVVPCQQNCNFQRLLSVPSSFSENGQNFITSILQYLPPNVQASCRTTFSNYFKNLPSDASSVMTNINSNPAMISLYSPSQIANFLPNNTIAIAQALTTGNLQVSPTMAKSLGKNIPPTQSLSGIASIASGVPLTCFNATPPSTLVNLISSMDLNNMDSTRKNFIGSMVASSNSSSVITNMLLTCSDPSIIGALSTNMLTSLNINVSRIPATNLPPAFLKSYSRGILASNSLANITDSGTLQKILPGITKSDLTKIPDSSKLNTLVNMVSASIASGIQLTYVQRTSMLNSLLSSLRTISNSALPSVYLSLLNNTHLQSLYVLFIEANDTILSAFSRLSTFSYVVSQAAQISSSQCCNYLRSSRQLFAKYAISSTITNTILQYSDLLNLGSCFASAIPTSYLQSMNASDFVSYFSNVGSLFQPDSTQQTTVSSLISTYAATQSSQESLVFSTLNDLAVYYPNLGNLDLATFKTSGAQSMSNIKANRDPTQTSVQLCRIGLTNAASASSIISTFGSAFANAYINSPSKRKRRAITILTCTDINNLAGSLNSLSTTQLATLSSSDFTTCQTTLGLASNSWSSDQLSTLATKAKNIYTTASNIGDTNIASLNSIMLGFSNSDLQTLQFTSISSISALGALSGWSSSQLNALNTPLMTYINANGLSSTLLSSMNNLACALTSSYVSGISTSVFSASVSSLAGISLSCPNAAAWYTLAKQVYGASLVNSTSSLTEMGSIISGITSSDFTSISSDAISSVTASAWTIMPVGTVNLLTTSQINGLSNTALNALINSPNYSSFSSVIQSNLNSAATGSTAQASNSNSLKFSLAVLIFNSFLAFLFSALN